MSPVLLIPAGVRVQHSLAMHSAVAQSELPLHALPLAHAALHDPPQSTSVSSPFFARSEQVGAVAGSGVVTGVGSLVLGGIVVDVGCRAGSVSLSEESFP